MIEVFEITLEKLRLFTGRSNTLVTIDAPLFGTVMVFNGRVLQKGAAYVEPEKLNEALKQKVPMFIVDVRTGEEFAKGRSA